MVNCQFSARTRLEDVVSILIYVKLASKWTIFFSVNSGKSIHCNDNLQEFAQENIAKGSLIKSDGFSAYKKFNDEAYEHAAENFDPEGKPDHLKWLHVAIANAKSFILGTYHGLDSKHLQAYLDEFIFRYNRRVWQDQLFNRICLACVKSPKYTRHELIG